jgi:hypothetical protein
MDVVLPALLRNAGDRQEATMSEVTTRWAPVTDRPCLQHPAPGSARSAHPARPDPSGDVLAVAWAPGLAPPREIRVRPELYDRILTQLDPAARVTVVEHHVLGERAGVPLVVDPELPLFPGFEVVRVRPDETAARSRSGTRHSAAAHPAAA